MRKKTVGESNSRQQPVKLQEVAKKKSFISDKNYRKSPTRKIKNIHLTGKSLHFMSLIRPRFFLVLFYRWHLRTELEKCSTGGHFKRFFRFWEYRPSLIVPFGCVKVWLEFVEWWGEGRPFILQGSTLCPSPPPRPTFVICSTNTSTPYSTNATKSWTMPPTG